MTEANSALGFIHRYMPPESGNDARTLLLLHGTGGNEDDLLSLGSRLAPGAGLLSPRGQVSENGMPRFFRRLAEGVFDMEDLIHRTHELADFVEAAAKAYAFDADKIVAAGYSNGANIAGAMLLLRPGVLRGAVLLRPMVPLEPENPPDLTGIPMFIAAGRQDPICPPAQAEGLISLLEGCGADVSVHWSPGGHGLDRSDLDSALEWMGRLPEA